VPIIKGLREALCVLHLATANDAECSIATSRAPLTLETFQTDMPKRSRPLPGY
jgi:hypothetical protein